MNIVVAAIFAYVALQMLVGVYVSRQIQNEDDYLLAGRSLGPVLATFSIFATWFGAETCIGAAGRGIDCAAAGTCTGRGIGACCGSGGVTSGGAGAATAGLGASGAGGVKAAAWSADTSQPEGLAGFCSACGCGLTGGGSGGCGFALERSLSFLARADLC